jgi:glyoxylase-like metal-dependent hydrolase (beta-lactamase superfamily II)
VVARNPSPFTFHGTGTFLVGRGQVAVVDPGPALDEHVEALLAALDGERVTHILVTHTHRDHSPAARALKAATGAPTYGFGPHGSGRIEAGVEVEEGGDREFVPDVELRHGDVVEGRGFTVEAVYTPGHTSNHLCFAVREEGALLSGDHVMGWNTSIISPPDGDLGRYLASLELLLERDDRIYWPTHGPAIEDPHPYVRAYLAHRHRRAEEVLECLRDGSGRIAEMVPRIYRDLPRAMHPAAARSTLATLVWLVEQGRVAVEGPLGRDAEYRIP